MTIQTGESENCSIYGIRTSRVEFAQLPTVFQRSIRLLEWHVDVAHGDGVADLSPD